MEKILITGALGFIGSHLIDLFQKKGYSLAVLDVPPRPSYFSEDIKYVQGSVTDKSAWQEALKGVDRVIHLAAYQGYLNDFSTYITVNASGTALLYEVIVSDKLPIKQIIFASSESVYGEGKYCCKMHGVFYPELRLTAQLWAHEWDIRCPKDNITAEVIPSEESDVMMPASPYAVSKASADHAARLLGRAYGVPTTILRFAMVYGAHDTMRELYAKSLNYFS
jgi:dTDP-L-rhamnose 4-epimerase